MFVTIKKRSLLIILAVALIPCIIVTTSVAVATRSKAGSAHAVTVVLDPGHGGADGGVTGTNSGVKESDINLKVSLIVKNKLESDGFNVVLTRSDEYGACGKDFGKSRDMSARKQIINSSNADLVVSIHCNKYPSSALRRGAQTFYNPYDPRGIMLAKTLQSTLNDLNKEHVGRDFASLKGDYYILNCSDIPSAIVECGFLSNPEDERLLLSAEYCDLLAEKIVLGIFLYLQENNL